MPPKVDRLIEEHNQLRGEMTAFTGIWRDCADHALPHRALTINTTSNVYRPDPKIHSDVATDALNTLASGLLGWTTPAQTPWFRWEPQEEQASEAMKQWLADCSSIAHRVLGNSNFYTQAHLFALERACFGTAAMLLEAGESRPLNFRVWPIGSYCISENSEQTVDRAFREFTLTARQAVDRFGDNAPAKCREAVANNRGNDRHTFIHAIYRRPDDERAQYGGPLGMPFASCVIYPSDKLIVEESGFESMPVFASRWLRWNDESPWGVSPAMMSIANVRGVNVMEMLLTAMAQLKVEPRIIAKNGATSTIDLSAGGITGVKDMADAPQTWADQGGEYRMGLELLERRENAIRRAFHTQLFEQISNIEREMTATEVQARMREQVGRISPAFTLLSTEFLQPMLERVFMLLFLSGRFPQPPDEAFVETADGGARLIFPRTIQTSRLALAVDSLNESALESTLNTFGPLAAAVPDILDNLDTDQAFREVSRGKGLPGAFLRKPEDRDAIRQARAEAAQAQQAMELAAKNPELAAAAATAAGAGA